MIKLEVLQLEVDTPRGKYGRTLRFDDGLTVIRGDNNCGKSTALTSILYALGLEGMLTAKHIVPLPHALSDYLEDHGVQVDVLSSRVSLQLRSDDKILTIRRTIKGESNHKLIRTWDTELTDDLDESTSRDCYARDGGALVNDDGFHNRLMKFMGWQLPTVAKFDGGESPLYPEIIFPLLFLEQKRGWLGLQARMPTHLRVRDPQARAVEFLLGFNRDDTQLRRARLAAQVQRELEGWSRSRAMILALAETSGAILRGLPEHSTADLPRAGGDVLVFPRKEEWVSAKLALQGLRGELGQQTSRPVPRVGAVVEEQDSELTLSEERLAKLDALQGGLQQERELVAAELNSMRRRLNGLEIDIVKNRDAKKLKSYGSMSRLALVKEVCATCSQPISEELGGNPSKPVMSVEDNLDFLQDMKRTISGAAESAERRLNHLEARLLSVRRERMDTRRQIRELKRSLVQRETELSEAELSRRIQLRREIADLERVAERFGALYSDFEERHNNLAKLREQQSSLATPGLGEEDERRLMGLQSSFISQIEEYGFSSVEPHKISISKEHYRPVAPKLDDLEFELSGSDLIRAIWSYFLGLLEASRTNQTNHPGFMIVDEPQQQGTESESITKMMRRAAEAGKHGQQVIVTRSSKDADLAVELKGCKYKVVQIDGWFLQPSEKTTVVTS